MRNIYTLLIAASLILPTTLWGQCISTLGIGTYSANGSNFNQQQIFSCNFAGDYATVTLPAGLWTFSTSVSTDFITITNTSNTVLETGTGSVGFATTSTITVRMHIFQNASCGEQPSCRTSYVQQDTLAAPNISAVDTFLCIGFTADTLMVDNPFGLQTYWYTGACNTTPIDSGNTLPVSVSSNTTYYANYLYDGNLSACGSFTVTVVPNPFVFFDSVQNVRCFGESSGALVALADSGSAPYDYTWNTGQTGATQLNLDTGFYSVTATDSFGCVGTTNITLTQPDPLTLSTSVLAEPACNGAATGSIQATVGGGTLPYNYIWSNGDQLATADSLVAGTYTLLVSDSNGCLIQDTVDISEPTAINISLVQKTDVECPGGSTGSIEIVAFGGVGTLSYDWSSGATSPSATGLSAGVYTVTVTDLNMCEQLYTDTINDPVDLQSTFDITPTTCNDSDDGSASISNTGGTAPYDYVWSTGATGNAITGVDTGTYLVTITDDNDCEYIVPVEVDAANPDPVIPLDSTAKLCEGFEITLDAGGDGADYVWSTGATTQTILVDSGGSYAVTVTTAAGCSADADILVVEELCVGVASVEEKQAWSVYPNPTRGDLFVESFNAEFEKAMVTLYSLDGKVVISQPMRSQIERLSLESFDKGVSLMHIENAGVIHTYRVLLQ